MKLYIDPHDRPMTPTQDNIDEPYLTESELPQLVFDIYVTFIICLADAIIT